MFNALYPDHWDTLHLQIANIACFFANIYTKKKGGGKWSIDDFMVKFERKKPQEKGNINDIALGIAVAFGDDKTKNWAEGKLKQKGIDVKSEDDEKEYKYPLERFVKNVKKLPARLRRMKNK